MLSRGHTSAARIPGGSGLGFGVPVQTAAAMGDYEPINPFDFPPGTPGSESPTPIPDRILAVLGGMNEGHVIAWQPYLGKHVLWKPKKRVVGGDEDLESVRSAMHLSGFSPHEVALVVDPLIRSQQSGWMCCFVIHNPFPFPWAGLMPQEACPLDNRFLALLYDSNPASYGGVKAMREQVRETHNRDVKADNDRQVDRFKEQYDAARTLTRISNIAPGNRSLLQNRPDLAARELRKVPDI